VIALDANVLIYAHRLESPFHLGASNCVRTLAEGRSAWAIPWPCLHEFYGIVTHPKRYLPPSSPAVAVRQIVLWMESPTLRLLGETPSHWPALAEMLLASDVKGPLVHDARIAAICLQHGVREFWTADRDFSRFPALKCHNPLIA
jgi:uncharacterized protein